MSAAYIANSKVKVSLDLLQEGIDVEQVEKLEYEVATATETIVSRTVVNHADGIASVEVSPEHNQLAPGKLRDLRLVRFYVTTAAGTSLTIVDYAIEGTNLLQTRVNSFQTYEEALLLSYETVGISSWMAASKQERINTLIEAYRDIAGLRFRYYPTYQNQLAENVSIRDITKITESEWDSLPADFKAALARAQLMQADYALSAKIADYAREQGVQSITVGESKNFFRQEESRD